MFVDFFGNSILLFLMFLSLVIISFTVYLVPPPPPTHTHTHTLQVILEYSLFHTSLFALAVEIVLYSYNSQSRYVRERERERENTTLAPVSQHIVHLASFSVLATVVTSVFPEEYIVYCDHPLPLPPHNSVVAGIILSASYSLTTSWPTYNA